MKILNRPMFRYGGPIKEGIMNGIQEPRQGYNEAGKVFKQVAEGYQTGPEIGQPLRINQRPRSDVLNAAAQLGIGNPYKDNSKVYMPMYTNKHVTKPAYIPPEQTQDDMLFSEVENSGVQGEGLSELTKAKLKANIFNMPSDLKQIQARERLKKETQNSFLPTPRFDSAQGAANIDEVLDTKDTVIDTEGNRKKSINNILEKLGYARSQKNALYDALIKGGQRIAREGLGKQGLVADLIQDTSTSYDKPEKIREAAELMQVQQDLKLEGIDRSKDNRGTIQKNADYYQSKDGGGYSKEVSIRMARNLPTTMSEYFAASKATSNQAKLYDATRAATKDGKLFGENVDYMGKINKKKYENISDFLITSPDDGVYNILGRVIVIKDGEKITEVVVQPEVDSKGWFKKSE